MFIRHDKLLGIRIIAAPISAIEQNQVSEVVENFY